MDDTDVDFKAMTGTGIDADDAVGIVEVDEEVDIDAPIVEDDASNSFELNGRPKEVTGEETMDEDYTEMEALLMDANGWEER